MKVKLYEIKDEYIDYLKELFPDKILNNRSNNKKRKYIGFILEINSFYYVIPLSSAKVNKDYKIIDYNKNGHEIHKLLKKRISLPVIFITENRNDNSLHVISKIQINNMLPIGNNIFKYVDCFDINKIDDYKYKDLLNKELNFINSNINRIKKNAHNVYKMKMNHRNDLGFIKNATPDFKLLEKSVLNGMQIIDNFIYERSNTIKKVPYASTCSIGTFFNLCFHNVTRFLIKRDTISFHLRISFSF